MAVRIEQDSFRFLAFPSMNIAVKVMVDQKNNKKRTHVQKNMCYLIFYFKLLISNAWAQIDGKTQASRLGSIDGLWGALPLVLSFGAEKIFGTV